MKTINNLRNLVENGKISRREFLARLSALGLATAVSPALIASPAKAATPKNGGRFRMGLTGGSLSDSLDPALVADQMDSSVQYAIRNNLVEVDYQLKAIPELAESWEAEPGAAKWIFKLRKGVEFHNGKTMTAEDVIDSINHHRGKDTKSGAKGLVQQIKDIQADGKYTVVFSLNGGNADFPYILNDYHLTIAPAGTKGTQWDEGIGTGGYVIKHWEPGVRASFKRNPNYFKAGRAHFDELEIIAIADDTARTNALKTGQIDYMNRAVTKTAHLLKKVPNVQVTRVHSGFHYTMPMLMDKAPYDDNDVRLALKYAVDREQLVKIFLNGYGIVGNDQPILIQKYYASDLPQRKYDPDRAKFHLKKAGMEGKAFQLYSSDKGNMMDMALIYKESAAKAGIKIDVIKEPEDGYWSNVWLKKPFVTAWWGGRPTADTMLSVAYSGDAPWNDTHFHNARFDKLLKEARMQLDESKRAQMYAECQKILSDEGGTIIPFFKDYVEAASKKVRFGKISGLWECDGHRATERWWFA